MCAIFSFEWGAFANSGAQMHIIHFFLHDGNKPSRTKEEKQALYKFGALRENYHFDGRGYNVDAPNE